MFLRCYENACFYQHVKEVKINKFPDGLFKYDAKTTWVSKIPKQRNSARATAVHLKHSKCNL